MQTNGTFFDGETAAERSVAVLLEERGVMISGPSVPAQDWRFSALAPVDPPHEDRPFRLTYTERPGTRLILKDSAFIAELLNRAPHLRGGFNPRAAGKAALWIAGGLGALVLAAYLVLQLAPQKLAHVLPDAWRERVGAQIERSLVGEAKPCEGMAGRNALAALVERFSADSPDFAAIAVKVYNVPIMNAFALPGGRIVITRELIEKAETAEEVAGIFAHELGHVVNRHSEAQLIRATGLQLLISLATGGGSDTISSLAGLATILRYTRKAEAEADAFALAAMEKAAVDPLGLKHFFERVLKDEDKASTGAFGKIEGVFTTHPGTEERIKAIQPLPAGIIPRPVLDAGQWQALKNICN